MNNQPITKIILVRHGRSTYNEQGKYQGSSDESVLTEKGQKTAYLTGLALKKWQFDAIYSSPLQRVQQTTQEIVKALHNFYDNVPLPKCDRRLQEVKMATWEGLSYAYVKKHLAQDYLNWQKNPHLFFFPAQNELEPKFYPLQELYQRAKSFLKEIVARHRGQTVLIVAHGGTNRALISSGIGLAPDRYHSLQQSNCGISCLVFTNNFTDNNSFIGQLKWLNVTHHLGENLPKLKEGKVGLRCLLVSNKIDRDSQLLKYLATEAIDLIISDCPKKSQELANIYQQQLAQIKHYSVANENLLNFWQNDFIKKQNSSHLITILAIVEESLLKTFLARIFTIKSMLSLDNNLNVIHYPQLDRYPILQGILPIHKIIESF
jgi:phosphoserine phosphatase